LVVVEVETTLTGITVRPVFRVDAVVAERSSPRFTIHNT
jgi:hypothetical protein